MKRIPSLRGTVTRPSKVWELGKYFHFSMVESWEQKRRERVEKESGRGEPGERAAATDPTDSI